MESHLSKVCPGGVRGRDEFQSAMNSDMHILTIRGVGRCFWMGGLCITFWVKGLELVFADVNKQMGIIKNHCRQI